MIRVADSFPEINSIADQTLRNRVGDVWRTALEQSDFEALADVPWWPPLEAQLDADGVSTVQHVRDVTSVAVAVAECLLERGYLVDLDLVIAGALVHDVSKLYELSTETYPSLNERLPHPHFTVHVLADAGFSSAVQHIALSHSNASAVAPQTIEASIVHRADQLAVDALFWTQNGALSP